MTPEPALPAERALFILVFVSLTIVVAIALNNGGIPSGPGAGTGTLTGNVTIGPRCPAEPCTVPNDRLAAAFAARPITISTPGGTVIASVTADPETGYAVALRPGRTWSISPTREPVGAGELPETVTIRNGETVRLNITVDIGIR